MASIGDKFSTPESGFKRYVYNESQKDTFYMNKMTYIRSWGCFSKDSDASITFYVKGATEIRCINLIESTCGVGKVYVNGNEYCDYYSTFTGTSYAGKTMGYELVSAIIHTGSEYTKVQIFNNSTKQFNFEAIDVNEDAELITQEEYEDGISAKFILNDNGTYKTYDESANVLNVIDDITSLDPNVLTGVKVDLLANALSLLSSTNGVKLIVSKNKSFKMSAIKNKNELIVMRGDFYTSQIANINSIFVNSNINENSIIKLAVSIDSGLNWKGYIDGNWITLPITIPQGKYNNLTTDEKLLWDNALSEIYVNGISHDIINNIDFNTLNAEKLRFAVVVGVNDYDGITKLENIMCNARSVDYLKECTCDEVERTIIGNIIKIKSNITAPKLVVNIVTAGITDGGAFDYDNAEHKPVFNGVTLEGVLSSDDVGVASKASVDNLTARIEAITGDRQEYKGYFATEADRDTVITSPEEGDYCVVDSSTSVDANYTGKTIKYTYQQGSWQIYMIVPTGQVEIDDNNKANDKTWSSNQISYELDKKQNIKGKYSVTVDASQLVLEETGEYNGFYKVPVTHGLGCGESFNLNVLNSSCQSFRMGTFFDNVSSNGFDLYSITKQTLKIIVEEV